MRGTLKVVTALSALALLTSACASASSGSGSGSGGGNNSSSSSAGATSFTACMVTDTGGLDDKSFNQSSWEGFQAANKADSSIAIKNLPSTSTADYARNISTFLGEKCGIIVTVGFLMASATETAAKANPNQKFAIVDCSYASACLHKPVLSNIDQLTYNTVQDAFLGGYLAAGMTKTGKVATYGGEQFGTVTIYMDGFWDGVQYYNKVHHKNVTVLGWSEKTQKGTFANSFTNQGAGLQIANTFINEGADIIFPVAGGVGLGTAKAIQTADSSGKNINMMWVDTDGCVSAAAYCKYMITSVEKGITTSVKDAILAAKNGTFKGGAYVGTLQNGGAVLAPYHDFQSKIPSALQTEVNQLKSQIESGKIKPATKSPGSRPRQREGGRPVKLELKGITKRFGSLVANDHIDLVVEPGEIRALLGENGAGKTTLMNVLYGLMQPDEGEILIDDKPARIRSPKDAINAGIGMVHQHFMLVPVFTVAENVTLGSEPVRRLRTPAFHLGGLSVPSLSVPNVGLLDRRRARREVLELSERYGLQVNPDAYVEDIPVGVQQRVEIIKALLRNASVLVLDEPTAVLTPNETQDLFRIMRELREGGRSIIFISHKLKEVQAIADTITVIRRGAVVGERPPSTSDAELAALMVGRSVQLRVSKDEAHPGDVRLAVQNLTVPNEAGVAVVDKLSFEVRGGEVLGIAGVQGNGQTELCEALMGLRPATGAVLLDGKNVSHLTTRDRLRAGVGYIPEDRKEDGLVSDFTVAENLILDVYDRPPYASGIAMDPAAVRRVAATQVADYDVRTTSVQTAAGTLSGGNQQKVILARELSRDNKVLLASQPTRGLDVGSIEFVHKQIVAQRDAGVAVVIVSSELDEIYALADRIAVMYEGRIVGFCAADVPEAELGLMMAGAGAAAAHAEVKELSPEEVAALALNQGPELQEPEL